MRYHLVILLVLQVICSALSISEADAANGSVTYTYDALGRILSATYDTGVIVYYTYDANGNRTGQAVNVNTATLQWSAAGSGGGCTANCWGGALW